MLTRDHFDKYMEYIDKEFRDQYTPIRKEVLYKRIAHLGQLTFDKTMITVIERFNRNNLPTVDQVAMLAKNQFHCDRIDRISRERIHHAG